MKQILIMLMFCMSANLFSQTVANSILTKKVFSDYQFHEGDKPNLNQLANTMKPNGLDFQQVKPAKSTSTFALILSSVGGFLVGWPIGTAIGGGDPNWTLAAIGAGLIVISIPLYQSAKSKARQGMNTSDGELQTSSHWNKSELNFSVTGNGIGLVLSF